MKKNLLSFLPLFFLVPAICHAQVNFSSSSLLTSQPSDQVTTGDFNGDGIADVATAYSYDRNISVIWGNGSGGFSKPAIVPTSDYSAALATADFNGDGKADLATIAGFDSVSVFLGNGTNGFAPARTFVVGYSANSLVTGDFNGDGKKDVATVNYLDDSISVLAGNGAGGFAAARNFAVADGTENMTAGDFDRDGKTDIASSNYSTNTVTILLSNGAGGFTLRATYPVAAGPYYLINADVNGDSKLDLIISRDTGISVLLGNGTGQFSLSSTFSVKKAFSRLAAADFNGDNKVDIAVSNQYVDKLVTFHLGDGKGKFTAGIDFAVDGYLPAGIISGDFNRDGKNDLVLGYASSGDANAITLLTNQTPPPTAGLPLISSFTPSVAPVDYNVIIKGTNFGGATAVKFNNIPTPFIVSSDTLIRAQVPVGATSGRISVSKLAGTATSTVAFTVALPAPTALQASASSMSRINLSWTKTLAGSLYTVEVATASGGPYTVLATLKADSDRYTHRRLAPETTLFYRVKATYTTSTSGYSNVISATTPITSPPNAPVYLTAEAVSKTQVNLVLQADNEIETNNMVLERARTIEGVYSTIATLNGYQDVFADGHLLVGISYTYRLKAVNSVGSSPYISAKVTTHPKVTAYNALAQWNKRLGGNANDWLSTLTRTADGGYLLGGRSLSGNTGDRSQPALGNADFWIVKLDAQGNKLWDKRYGGSGYDALEEIVTTTDGGYLLGGVSASGVGGDRSESLRGMDDYWVVKIDASGNRQWDHRYGGSGQDELQSLIKTADGGYLLGGFSASGADGDKSQPSQGGNDYWVVKVNANGAKQWDKRFGGSEDEKLASVVQNTDGSYVLGGSSGSPISGDQSQNPRDGDDGIPGDYWLVKINGSGTKLWDLRYGGSNTDNLSALIQTTDGGYLLGGSSNSGISGEKSRGSSYQIDTCGELIRYNYSNWLVKINGSGAKQWDKTLSGSNFPGTKNDDLLASLIPTSDGGYLVASTASSARGADKSETSWGNSFSILCSDERLSYQTTADYWIIKLGSDGGKQWDKDFGSYRSDALRAVVQDTDGSFVLAGYSDGGINGDKSQASQGSNDYWVVKTNPTSPPPSTVRLNSAGPAVATSLGNFTADNYTTGTSGVITSAVAIAGTTDDVLYNDNRQATTGDFGYNIPVTNGTYVVRLHFAETFYTAAGQRKLNVSAEGVSWLSNFDILADAGAAKKAAIKTRTVTVSDGYLTLGFASVVGKAMVSAIEIVPTSGAREGEAEMAATEGIRLQAYPNPFTTQVTLAFSVEQTDHVTLEVYDLQGALIRNLYQGEAEGGKTYEMTLGSETLRSGLYISRLATKNRVAYQKLVLVH